MKKTITILALCLIGTFSYAQAPAIQWQKCLGGTLNEGFNSIQQTIDGGYIITGSTTSNDGNVLGNHGGNDVWVVKLSAAGALEWQKCLGGTGTENAYNIQPTTDGGYIMAGYTSSTDGDVSGNHGGQDAWIVKLSSTGNIEWQKALGGTSDERAQSIQSTNDGGYILSGTTYSNDGDVIGNHGSVDAWVVKLSSIGNLEWQKALGGSEADRAFDIQTTVNGDFIMTGHTRSNNGDVNGNHGAADAWVVKLSNTGVIQWQKCFGGTDYEEFYGMQITPDGGFIITGYTESLNGDVIGNHGGLSDVWVVKLSSLGILQWQKCLGGTNSELALNIHSSADGSYIISGYTESVDGDISGNHGGYEAWVVKLSNSGNLLWQKCLGGSINDQFFSVQTTSDEGYIITGATNSTNGDVSGNHGGYDAWVVKLGPELATSTFNTQALTLYPNPTNGLLQLQTPNNTSFNKIIITDSTGKIVLEQTQNTTQVNVEKLASGLYIIKAFSGEEVFVNKFVKE